MIKTLKGSVMRHKLILVLMACAAASGARAGTWNGVYTDAQAERGSVQFQQHCARCHGANLAGTFETPPLVGRFMPYWSGATLDTLFDYIATAMPLGSPGSLSRAANADILAFILKANNFPAGAKELSGDSEELKAIRFDAVRPPPETAPKPSRKKNAKRK
ncbi:MAG TPA: cytochrome c [Rhizomicrobium sp.]|nr:cytochrome c [Rhizomicrobium sp.]